MSDGAFHTQTFMPIGAGNVVNLERCVAIVQADSAPARRMIQEARDRQLLIDASSGRKTRAVLVLDSEHILLSALTVEELSRAMQVESQAASQG